MQTRLTLLGRVSQLLERRSAPSMQTTGAGIYSRQSRMTASRITNHVSSPTEDSGSTELSEVPPNVASQLARHSFPEFGRRSAVGSFRRRGEVGRTISGAL